MMSNFPSEEFTQLARRLFHEDEDHYPVLIKEMLQIDILDAMGEAGLFRQQLVFKGGTALRLCYRSLRYSEDLDFSAIRPLHPSDIDNLKQTLDHVIHRRYGLELDFDASGSTTTTFRGIHHWRARMRVPMTFRPDVTQTHVVRLDIAEMPVFDKVQIRPVMSDSIPNRQPLAAVMTLPELLTEKLVALIERNRLKWRDVFDIWYLGGRGIEPNSVQYQRKLEDRRIPITAARRALQERGNLLTEESATDRYIRELSRFLRADGADRLSPTVVRQVLLQVTDTITSLRRSLDPDETLPSH